jgi:hypothetical protein
MIKIGTLLIGSIIGVIAAFGIVILMTIAQRPEMHKAFARAIEARILGDVK